MEAAAASFATESALHFDASKLTDFVMTKVIIPERLTQMTKLPDTAVVILAHVRTTARATNLSLYE